MLLTCGLTYPLILHLDTAVFSVYGDPLLNTWILAWDVHKLFTDPQNLFHANIFYPHRNVLAYSENLLASSLLAAPVLWISQNPILAYNFVFLFSFAFSGFGTYLLVWHLTRNSYASFLSGIIFAFSPYKFSHLGHLQLLTTQWIPFCFLFLHRLLETASWKYLFLFWLFFILQALSSSYYGLFLSVSLITWIGSYWLLSRIGDRAAPAGRGSPSFLLRSSFWAKLGCFLVLSALVLYPIGLPYFKVQEEMGFVRTLGEVTQLSAEPRNYLGVPHFNWLYGSVLVRFAKMEGMLFPGALALVFAALSIVRGVYYTRRRPVSAEAGLFLKNAPVLNAYGVLILAAGILSLGPRLHVFGETFDGPYRFLYNYVPGFKGLRVPARLGVMVSFGVSVLAGYGFLALFEAELIRKSFGSLKNRLFLREGVSQPSRHLGFSTRRFLTGAALSALLVAEYYSAPIPLHRAVTGEQVPEIYRWLARQEGDFPILELPLQANPQDYWMEAYYAYFSTYHWKKLVNGYSGFSPPSTVLLHQIMETFPDEVSLQVLQRLQTKYVIIHAKAYSKPYLSGLLQRLGRFTSQLEYQQKLDGSYIYKFKEPAEAAASLPSGEPLYPEVVGLNSPTIEAVRSNYNAGEAVLAVDGNLKTRWTTGTPQRPGMYFELDMGTISSVTGVLLDMGTSLLDYPRQCRVEVSKDAVQWEPVSLLLPPVVSLFEASLQTPRRPRLKLAFSQPIQARFIRIFQTRQHGRWAWSIHEIQVY